MLRQIAEATGGAYQPLGERGEGLESLYSRYIEPLPKQHLEDKREKIPYEWFEWPLAAALLLLINEFLLRERISQRSPQPAANPGRAFRKVSSPAPAATVALLLGMLLGASVLSRAAETDYSQGVKNYQDGRFYQAEEDFRRALETPDLSLQDNSYYNLGNSQFKHGDAMKKIDQERTRQLWEQSLHSYESAIKLNPAKDAKHNYEVVKKKLDKLKQEQKKQQEKKQNKGGGSSSQQQPQNSPGNQDKNPSNSPGNQPQDQKGNPQPNGSQNQPTPGGDPQPQDQTGQGDDSQKNEPGTGKKKMAQQSARSQGRDKESPGPRHPKSRRGRGPPGFSQGQRASRPPPAA